MRWTPALAVTLTAAAFSFAANAFADIYRYVDDQGVTCYTDTPMTPQAVIVMRDIRKKNATRDSGLLPVHLAATGIANKIGRNNGKAALDDDRNSSLAINGRVTSTVGFRHDPFDGKIRFHNGVDIAVPSGTPVKPMAPGVVLFSGTRPGYGNTVILEHSDGTISLYAHNSLNLVTEGTYVQKQSTIALSGSTGRSTGPHLHFEAWKNNINVTSAYVQGVSGEGVKAALSQDNTVRRSVDAEGTLVFTNLQ